MVIRRIRYRYHFLTEGKVRAHRERQQTFPPPKRATGSFLMNSFRFPCLNVRMAWARAEHVVESRKMFVISFSARVHLYNTRTSIHFTRVTNSNRSTVSKRSTGCSVVSCFFSFQPIVDFWSAFDPKFLKKEETRLAFLKILFYPTLELRLALFGVQSPSICSTAYPLVSPGRQHQNGSLLVALSFHDRQFGHGGKRTRYHLNTFQYAD